MVLVALFLFDLCSFLLDELSDIIDAFIMDILNENDGEILTSVNIDQTANILSFVLDELSYVMGYLAKN